jgi:hypothetical protein
LLVVNVDAGEDFDGDNLLSEIANFEAAHFGRILKDTSDDFTADTVLKSFTSPFEVKSSSTNFREAAATNSLSPSQRAGNFESTREGVPVPPPPPTQFSRPVSADNDLFNSVLAWLHSVSLNNDDTSRHLEPAALLLDSSFCDLLASLQIFNQLRKDYKINTTIST